MGRVVVALRRAGGTGLSLATRWPWLPLALAVVVVAVGGELGRVWLLLAVGVVVMGGMAVVVQLFRRGRESVGQVIWRDQLLAQLELYWDTHLWPRLQGLTDEEYFWEPVDGCWTIRPRADGAYAIDWAWPTPERPPMTTLAWRLAQVGVQTLGVRASNHFGDGSLTLETAKWPGSAAEALASLEENYHLWLEGVRRLGEADLAEPIGPAEGQWADQPFAALVFHLNREIMHQGGEICLLRDLYRARATSGRL